MLSVVEERAHVDQSKVLTVRNRARDLKPDRLYMVTEIKDARRPIVQTLPSHLKMGIGV